jgi:hypothetical protein
MLSRASRRATLSVAADSAPQTKHGETYVNHMGKAAKSFTARSHYAIPLRYHVTMGDQPRQSAIFKGRNLTSTCRNRPAVQLIPFPHGSS